MRRVYFDFETFSYANLPDVGAYRYAEHPTTEVLCYAIAVDDSPVSLCIPDDQGKLAFPVDMVNGDFTFVAHNFEFEREVLRHRYRTLIPVDRWEDTAALATRMSLPRRLEHLAVYFGFDVSEKKAANTGRLEDSVCRPRKASKNNLDTRWFKHTKPDGFAALYQRCVQDVELERACHLRLKELEPSEKRVWQVTIAMNERGVKVDMPSVPLAQAVLEKDGEPLIAEFEIMVGEKLKSPVKVAAALGLPDVQKSTVRKALRDPATPPGVHRALSILQALSKSSGGKLDSFLDRAHSDDRVRGSFLYCGAERTNRWSSRGTQFQNFKRGLGAETEQAFRALRMGILEYLYDGVKMPPPDPPLTPTGAVAEMLRGFIIPEEGSELYVGDLAQIEARGIAWLAGDEKQLDIFRAKKDPYCAMASDIYRREITKRDKAERFMGKTAELSCGYQVSGETFQANLDEKFDVQVELEFAENVVAMYRARHKPIVDFWDRLKDGMAHVIATKRPEVRITKHLWMGYEVYAGKPYLWIRVPSGLKMYYAEPALKPGRKGPTISYFGRDKFTKGWGRVRTYGGMIAENVTQRVARDVIAGGMLRLNDAGFYLTMTVHDELVAEENGTKTLKDFGNLISQAPAWAAGLPIEVDTFRALRYRK